MTLPDGARRLFSQFPRERLADAAHAPLIVERLLEDGDGADLCWLTVAVPEEDLAGWVRGRGARRLSRRSRAFWEIVLDAEAGAAPEPGNELWPLL